MIKTQIIKDKKNKPAAVIMDIKEFIKMKELIEDRQDYRDALEAEKKSKKFYSLEDLEKKIGL